MGRFCKKTLVRKLVSMLFLGFLVACIIFTVLSVLGNEVLDEYFASSDFIYNAETPYIEELRSYVQKLNIQATDTTRLGEWAHKKGIGHFTISRERVLLYDSAYSDTVILGQAEAEMLHYNWQYFHTVTFADGEADVYIYKNYETKYYILLYTLAGILSVAVWMIFFVFGISKEVRYIQQLSHSVTQIGMGRLNSEISVKGEDELGNLARGLNQMRLSLIEKENTERELKSAQDKLVLGMAHDLRTPLTGLMTYLEIAKKQENLEDCARYVDKAFTKTAQIRELSNQLFEFLLISSKQPMQMEQPEDLEYALGEYLSELCGLLETDGFRVHIDKLCWKSVQIQICTDYAGRIINNLLSNIKKYGDPSVPLELSVKYSPSHVSITVRNKSMRSDQYVQGTGIGVKNIYTMMTQMNGNSSVQVEADYYSITLSFPIVKVEAIEL